MFYYALGPSSASLGPFVSLAAHRSAQAILEGLRAPLSAASATTRDASGKSMGQGCPKKAYEWSISRIPCISCFREVPSLTTRKSKPNKSRMMSPTCRLQ